MTPQEVANHAFAKATLGGYNMAMVDEFLDLLTEDYTTLYNDNAILKNKMKVLTETVEEYRATDGAMRKTLLAAQQLADTLVADAEAKKAALLQDAESAARARIDELKAEIAAEEFRLRSAQEATAAYAVQTIKILDKHRDFLVGLDKLMYSGQNMEEAVEEAVSAIEDAVGQITGQQDEQASPVKGPEAEKPANEDNDTRVYALSNRFNSLEFGKDYNVN